jgi:hypothetical protein
MGDFRTTGAIPQYITSNSRSAYRDTDYTQQSSSPASQQSSSPAVQQCSSPAVQQSSSPALQQSSNPAVQQSSNPAVQGWRVWSCAEGERRDASVVAVAQYCRLKVVVAAEMIDTESVPRPSHSISIFDSLSIQEASWSDKCENFDYKQCPMCGRTFSYSALWHVWRSHIGLTKQQWYFHNHKKSNESACSGRRSLCISHSI